MFEDSSKSNCVLSFIVKKIDPSIWHDSIELYRSGNIAKISYSNDLISTYVNDHRAPRKRWDIRLKLQSQGSVIRWFECGCPFQRKTGLLCEHLVATIIMIERENSKILKALNPNAPFAIVKIGSPNKKKSKSSNRNSSLSSDYSSSSHYSNSSFGHIQTINPELSQTPSTSSFGAQDSNPSQLSIKSLSKDFKPHTNANANDNGKDQAASKQDSNLVEKTLSTKSISFVDGSSSNHSQFSGILSANPSVALILKSTIVDISLVKSTGKLKITFELRRSKKDQITLSIDESAAFLYCYSGHPRLDSVSLQVHNIPVYNGWEIDGNSDQEVWKISKVGMLLVDQASASNEKLCSSIDKLDNLRKKDNTQVIFNIVKKDQDHNHDDPKFEGKSLYSFDVKHIDQFGNDYFIYFDNLGYFPYQKFDNERSLWSKSHANKYYKGEDLDNLIESRYGFYKNIAPVLIPRDLYSLAIVDAKLVKINIIDHQQDIFFIDPICLIDKKFQSIVDILALSKSTTRRYISDGTSLIKIPPELYDLDFLIDSNKKAVQISLITLLRWRSLTPSLDSMFDGDQHLVDKLKQSLNFNPQISKTLSLDHTNLKLLDYQTQGLKWLWWLYNNNLHGLFADDMGLGKTHQTMALLSMVYRKLLNNKNTVNLKKSKNISDKSKLQFLVICPTTVVGHWIDKISEFAPVLNPLRYHGSDRAIDESCVTLVTSYGVLLRDIDKLANRKWEVVVCDEAHVIKNPKTSTYWTCKKLKAKMRLCLSGTPIENRLSELKTLFDFLLPGFLGNSQFFKKYYGISFVDLKSDDDKHHQSIKNNDNKNRLLRLIEPLKLRRTKKQVLSDLPEKIEDIRHCELSSIQRKLYAETLEFKGRSFIADLQDESKSVQYMHIFTMLQRLKQICNHPALVTGNAWDQERSEKFELLKELVDESLRSEHKVAIFTQYVKMIEIINAYLNSQGISYVSLQGSTRNRDQVVGKFQNDPKVKVFVGSLIAGGVGIDLTAASVVIHYDRWWNPSKEDQATDRVHRIGQKNSLLVLKLVTLNTIEEKIDAMIQRKKLLFDTLLTSNMSQFKQFTRKELIELVSHGMDQNKQVDNSRILKKKLK